MVSGNVLNSIVLVAITVTSVLLGVATHTHADTHTQTPVALFHALVRKAATPQNGLHVVLGYNVCLDVVVRARDVFKAASSTPGDRAYIRTHEDLSAAFTHYFAQGAAAERSCDPEVFQAALAGPFLSGALPGRRALGGNAALMARKLAHTHAQGANISVTVVGQIGPDAAALLPASVERVNNPGAKDEMHFILEYTRGEALVAPGSAHTHTHTHVSPRANRFIVTADTAHLNANAMLDGITAADDAGADTLVVAGLHMMEPLPAATRENNLNAIAGALASRAGKYSVHLELASAADATYVRMVAENLFEHVDSVGFNEQELAFLYESVGGTYGMNSDDPASRADITGLTASGNAVARALRFILEKYPALSRLHFHALPFHVVVHASRMTAPATKKWRDPVGSAAAGAVTATTDACGKTAKTIDEKEISTLAKLVVDIRDPRATSGRNFTIDSVFPVAVWTWPLTEEGASAKFALAPVAVCAHPESTVGLGDAISAAGLAADARNLA